MSDDPVYPGWRDLACAILERAHKDARGHNGVRADARQFLAGDGAKWLWDCLNLDPDRLERLREDLALHEELPAPSSIAGGRKSSTSRCAVTRSMLASAPIPEQSASRVASPVPSTPRADTQTSVHLVDEPLPTWGQGGHEQPGGRKVERRRLQLALELAAGRLTPEAYRAADDDLLAKAGLSFEPDKT